MDVTNDGSMVVGSYNNSPGVWLKSSGTWVNLPKVAGYSSGGCIHAVTPDGKYAVGECNFGQFSAYPCFWNLEDDGVLVELDGLPLLDMQNEDNDQQRFCGISPDGNYILGSVSHSYIGPPGIFWYIYNRTTKKYQPIGFDVTYKNGVGTWTARAEHLLFIDRAVMTGIPSVTIVHGKGTGALRAAVWDILRLHPNVANMRLGKYGEGDSGVTIVELKR
jgi:hypothetical protein